MRAWWRRVRLWWDEAGREARLAGRRKWLERKRNFPAFEITQEGQVQVGWYYKPHVDEWVQTFRRCNETYRMTIALGFNSILRYRIAYYLKGEIHWLIDDPTPQERLAVTAKYAELLGLE